MNIEHLIACWSPALTKFYSSEWFFVCSFILLFLSFSSGYFGAAIEILHIFFYCPIILFVSKVHKNAQNTRNSKLRYRYLTTKINIFLFHYICQPNNRILTTTTITNQWDFLPMTLHLKALIHSENREYLFSMWLLRTTQHNLLPIHSLEAHKLKQKKEHWLLVFEKLVSCLIHSCNCASFHRYEKKCYITIGAWNENKMEHLFV